MHISHQIVDHHHLLNKHSIVDKLPFHDEKESTEERTSDVERSQPDEDNEKKEKKGRVAGDKFLKDLNEEDLPNADHGPLKKVDADVPLTLTRNKKMGGSRYHLAWLRRW